jgi:hypothetical protein
MNGITKAQREALGLLRKFDGVDAIYLSNRTDAGARTISATTADALERKGLVTCEDTGRIGTAWVVRLTDSGREERDR